MFGIKTAVPEIKVICRYYVQYIFAYKSHIARQFIELSTKDVMKDERYKYMGGKLLATSTCLAKIMGATHM